MRGSTLFAALWRLRRTWGLLMLGLLVLATCAREPLPRPDYRLGLRFTPLSLPPERVLTGHLGAFRLEGAWRMDSGHAWWGGFSALATDGEGGLLAVSDRGFRLHFRPPGRPPLRAAIAPIWPLSGDERKITNDAEAMTRDPASGRVWIAWEQRNTISRHDPAFVVNEGVWPKPMRKWGGNAGPEAMVRLRDGRFVVLREGFTGWGESQSHPAVLFPSDPVEGASGQRFTFAGPPEFSPTDMAQLPDGRVLVLMRRAVWPLPFRFAGRIAVADPAAIRPGQPWRAKAVARLGSSLPVDNFEGLAVEPGADGRITVWLISDDNAAVSQRTLLWRLSVDPADL